ncbi:MAG: hypothetical protein ABI051_03215 [Vicinamibacterales bacterium]
MTFPVEIVLKGRDFAVTESIEIPHGEPASWDDSAVHDLLVEVLGAMARQQDPAAASGRVVVLQGFSWIVEPLKDQVVIAIEIPMGAAVAGPFAIGQAELDSMIARVLRAERQTLAPSTIH